MLAARLQACPIRIVSASARSWGSMDGLGPLLILRGEMARLWGMDLPCLYLATCKVPVLLDAQDLDCFNLPHRVHLKHSYESFDHRIG